VELGQLQQRRSNTQAHVGCGRAKHLLSMLQHSRRSLVRQ
jgi:hypothetical protein